MLTKLRLRSFQSHKELEIDLDPFVTILVGPSDIGKSAILRGIQWLCLNEPQGMDFIRWGSPSASIRLEVDEHTIIRKRGEGINLYSLDGQKFKAFGTKVPAPIADLLNVDSVNFAGQLEAPFWFLLSPPQVSRELNAIVNLTAIDSSLAFVAGEVRNAKAEVSVCEQRYKQAKAEKRRLTNVPIITKLLNKVKLLDEKASEIASKIDDLQELLKEVVERRKQRQIAARTQQFGEDVLSLGSKVLELEKQERSLRKLLQSIADVSEEQQTADNEAERLKTDLQKKTKGLCPICQKPLKS